VYHDRPEWTPRQPARPAEHLIAGLTGPVVLLSARVAAQLDRDVLDHYRRNHRGTDREVDETLIAIRIAALLYVGRASVSDPGQNHAPPPATGASWLTVQDAASKLGCSPRSIRRSINNGRLAARRVGPLWLINPTELHQHADQRGT